MTTPTEPDLNAVVERLIELRQEKRYIEGEIERVSGVLAEALGEGQRLRLGAVDVRVSTSRPGVRIVRAADVPEVFCSLQPDRKLLLAHMQKTGEVPPGVAATVSRPVVYAKGPGGDDGDGQQDAGG